MCLEITKRRVLYCGRTPEFEAVELCCLNNLMSQFYGKS
jgi:hypothetical protein